MVIESSIEEFSMDMEDENQNRKKKKTERMNDERNCREECCDAR